MNRRLWFAWGLVLVVMVLSAAVLLGILPPV